MGKTITLSLVVHILMASVPIALAMPSQKEMSDVQPMVDELMNPLVKDYMAKKKTAVEVGAVAMGLVSKAKSQAAKFALLKCAVTYYSRAKEYDKAADSIESIMELVPDIPSETLYDITSKVAAKTTAKNAPRLMDLNEMARKRVSVKARLKELEKKLTVTPGDVKLKRLHAELAAATGNWEATLAELADLGGEIGKMAAADANTTSERSEVADFWWNYKPMAGEAADAIRERAVSLYKEALAHGELTGLKKALAEKRIAEAGPARTKLEFAPTQKYKFNYRLNDKGEAFLCRPNRKEPCVSPKPIGILVIPMEIDGHKVVGIDDAAFESCDEMTRIVLPKYLQRHGWYWGCEFPGGAFHHCRSLSCIDVAPGNPYFTSVDGVWYSKDKKTLLAYPKTRHEIKLVPECRFLLGGAFDSCCFVDAKIPEGVNGMHYWIFNRCDKLETVDFPHSFTNWIGAYCFSSCPKLRKIRFHGDAPSAYVRRNSSRNNCMSWAPKELVIEVERGTKGWAGKGSTVLPERWPLNGSDSRPIRYIE